MAGWPTSHEHRKSSLFRRRPADDAPEPDNTPSRSLREVDDILVRPRPSALSALIDTAWVFSERSTCSRLHVGAVIAQNMRIVSTGYNGAPAGVEHCDHTCWCSEEQLKKLRGGHLPQCKAKNPCTVAVHAEANAIAFAARHGVKLDGCGIYTTHAPCFNCSLLIKSAGIIEVVFEEPFRDMSGPEFLIRNGVRCGPFKRHPSDDIVER